MEKKTEDRLGRHETDLATLEKQVDELIRLLDEAVKAGAIVGTPEQVAEFTEGLDRIRDRSAA